MYIHVYSLQCILGVHPNFFSQVLFFYMYFTLLMKKHEFFCGLKISGIHQTIKKSFPVNSVLDRLMCRCTLWIKLVLVRKYSSQTLNHTGSTY